MNVTLTTPHAVIDGLPMWCGGVVYESADNVIVLRVGPAHGSQPEGPEELVCSPDEARALVDALTRCLTAADRVAKVLDVAPFE